MRLNRKNMRQRRYSKNIMLALASAWWVLTAASPAQAAEPGKNSWWQRLSLGLFQERPLAEEAKTWSSGSFPAYEAVAGDRVENRLRLGGERVPHAPVYIFSPAASTTSFLDHYSEDSQALYFYLGYDLTSRLNLRGTVGIAGPGKGGASEDEFHLIEQTRRWGVDFAASYRLLDNLVYQAHLGYVSLDHNRTAVAPSRLGESLSGAATLEGEPSSLYQIGSHIRMTF